MNATKLIAALTVLIIVLSSCAQATPPAPKAPAQSPSGVKEPGPPITMKIGSVPDYPLMAPLLVALEKGYFKEANINVGDLPLGTGARVSEMLMAKEIDFMNNSSLPALIGIDKGVPLKIIATVVNGGYFALWVRSGLSDKVRSINDLKGLKIGTTGPGTGCHAALLFYVKKAGLNARDVEWVTVGDNSPATWGTAFKSNLIDGGCVWPTVRPPIEEGKLAFPLIDIHDKRVLKEHIGDSLSPMVIVTRQDVIDNNPQWVQRRINEERRGLQFINSHSPQEVAEVAAPRLKMDIKMATTIGEQQKGNFSPDGRVSRSGIEAEIEIAYGAGLLSKRLKYEDVVDDRFAGSAP